MVWHVLLQPSLILHRVDSPVSVMVAPLSAVVSCLKIIFYLTLYGANSVPHALFCQYYVFEYPAGVDSVKVKVTSEDDTVDLCAIVSVQDGLVCHC